MYASNLSNLTDLAVLGKYSVGFLPRSKMPSLLLINLLLWLTDFYTS